MGHFLRPLRTDERGMTGLGLALLTALIMSTVTSVLLMKGQNVRAGVVKLNAGRQTEQILHGLLGEGRWRLPDVSQMEEERVESTPCWWDLKELRFGGKKCHSSFPSLSAESHAPPGYETALAARMDAQGSFTVRGQARHVASGILEVAHLYAAAPADPKDSEPPKEDPGKEEKPPK